MRHKALAAAALGGMLCLPASYWLSRHGPIALSALVIAVVACASGVMAIRMHPEVTTSSAVAAFAVAVLLMELSAFALYYSPGGNDDPKLAVGLALCIAEAVAILLIGGVVLAASMYLSRRRRSNAA